MAPPVYEVRYKERIDGIEAQDLMKSLNPYSPKAATFHQDQKTIHFETREPLDEGLLRKISRDEKVDYLKIVD